MANINSVVAFVLTVLSATACGQTVPTPSPEQDPRPTPEARIGLEASPERGVPPEFGVLYARVPSADILTAQTREVSVRLEPQREDNGPLYVLHIEVGGGRSARHPWPEGGPFSPDEIYLLDGYACERDLIDIVVRSAPPEYSDGPGWFTYVRFLIDKETLDLAALVPADPSVEVAFGVAAVQSLTSPDGRWPVFAVECGEGGVESITVREDYEF